MRRLRELEQVGERRHALDLDQVDERLDGLALAEEEAERARRSAAVLVLEPEAEQAPAWSRSRPDSRCARQASTAARTPLTRWVPSLGLRRSGPRRDRRSAPGVAAPSLT